MRRVLVLAVLASLALPGSAIAAPPTIKQAHHVLAKERPFLEAITCKRAPRSVRCTAQIVIEAHVVNSNGEESTKSTCPTPPVVTYAFSVYRASHQIVIKQLPEPPAKVECPV